MKYQTGAIQMSDIKRFDYYFSGHINRIKLKTRPSLQNDDTQHFD